MTKTKEEILKMYPHGKLYINNAKAWQQSEVLKAMQAYADQQTATLYTLSEVQKIVENVREAVIKEVSLQSDRKDIRDIDLNQFIKQMK